MSWQPRTSSKPGRRPAGRATRTYLLWVVVVLFVASGASCPRMVGRGGPMVGPVLLAPSSSLDQVLAVVNRPASVVRQLRSVGGRLKADDAPQLIAELALERPRRLRLTARLGVSLGSAPEIDLGSDDGLYWMSVPRQQTIYVGRHDETPHSFAGQLLPVPPVWLMDALGLVDIQPADVQTGPSPSGTDRLVLHARLPGHTEIRRTVEIDAQRGLVLTQHLYDASGRLLVSAHASDHRYLSEYEIYLPHRVEIDLPLVPSRLTLSVSSWLVNQLPNDSQALWQMPSAAGLERVEMTSSRPLPRGGMYDADTAPAANGGLRGAPYPSDGGRNPLGGIHTQWQEGAGPNPNAARPQRLPVPR